MRYEPAKGRSITLKAALLVAFFVSFFTAANIFNDGTVQTKTPKLTNGYLVDCRKNNGESLGTVFIEGGSGTQESFYLACQNIHQTYFDTLAVPYDCPVNRSEWESPSYYKRYYNSGLYCNGSETSQGYASYAGGTQQDSATCPPVEHPSYIYPIDENNDQQVDACADPNSIGLFDSCPAPNSAILPAGTNTAQNMCYTLADGSICAVSKRSNGTYTYAEGNCYLEQNEPYQEASGTTDENGCTDFGTATGCPTDPADVCSSGPTIDGSEYYTCATGCGDYNGTFMCFTNDDDANVIPGDDFEQDNPDANNDGTVDTSDTNQILGNLQSLTNVGNNTLAQMNNTLGDIKRNTDVISSFGQGIGETNSNLSGVNQKLEELKEKETYTTTTTEPDKTKFNDMFNQASIDKLNTEIEALQTQAQTELNTIRAEASALMTISVPSGGGYQERNLTLTQGSFDLSLNRFSDFFRLLAGPVMLICSVLAGFILLGGKD